MFENDEYAICILIIFHITGHSIFTVIFLSLKKYSFNFNVNFYVDILYHSYLILYSQLCFYNCNIFVRWMLNLFTFSGAIGFLPVTGYLEYARVAGKHDLT